MNLFIIMRQSVRTNDKLKSHLDLPIPKIRDRLIRACLANKFYSGKPPNLGNLIDLLQVVVAECPIKYLKILLYPVLVEALDHKTHFFLVNPPQANLRHHQQRHGLYFSMPLFNMRASILKYLSFNR